MSAFAPPPQIKGSMSSYVASVEIELGEAVSLDPANAGNVILQDNFTTKLPCIGIAANNAEVGQIVWVQSSSIIIVPTSNTCTPGDFVGSAATLASDSTMNDLGSPSSSFVSPISIVGIAISQSGNQLKLLITPYYFNLSSLSGVVTNITSYGGGGYLGVQPGMLPNLNARRFPIANNSSTSTINLYTCPTGKRALVFLEAFNSTAGTLTGRLLISYDGGITFFTADSGVISTGTLAISFNSFMLEAGEILAFVGSATGYNIAFSAQEFDNTSPFRKVTKNSGWIAGDNMFYTCPIGKRAIFISEPGLQNPALASFVFANNDTGTTAIYKLNLVPNGGTPSLSNQIAQQGGVASPGSATGLRLPQSVLSAGDFLSINTNQVGQQSADAFVIEIPA